MLAGGEEPEPAAVTYLAERLGVSTAAVSRAVDALVRERLVTRVEDKHDRRVRRVAITARGRDLAGELIAARMVGLEAFAASLSGAQRRKLDSAFDSLLERQEIASTFEELKGVRPQ
jgi:DNA-binding MarR family transcriptional regulator